MLSRNLFQPRTEYLDSFIHFCLASSEPPGAGGAGVSIPPFHTATIRRTTSKPKEGPGGTNPRPGL